MSSKSGIVRRCEIANDSGVWIWRIPRSRGIVGKLNWNVLENALVVWNCMISARIGPKNGAMDFFEWIWEPVKKTF